MLLHHAAIPILEQFKTFFVNFFDDNLVGMYVHGSLTEDCYNPALSDIDFVVVIRNPLSAQMRHEIVDFSIPMDAQAPGKGVEYNIITLNQIRNFIYPTPNELTFPHRPLETHTREELYAAAKPDPCIAAHIAHLQRGVTLVGAPIDEVFNAVLHEDLQRALISDAHYIKEAIIRKPFYGVLNLCRIYAYRLESIVLSKKEGGTWALENSHIDAKYYHLVRQALHEYETAPSTNWQTPELLTFFEYMYSRISAE